MSLEVQICITKAVKCRCILRKTAVYCTVSVQSTATFSFSRKTNDFSITPCQIQLISIILYVNVIVQQLLTKVYVQYITSMWQVSVIIHHILFDIQRTVHRDILL